MNTRLTGLLGAVVLAMAACSSSQPATFSLAGASVDPTYWCPGGSTDAPYSVHMSIQARNDTAQAVTIDSATAQMVLSAVNGNWAERVGDRYDAGQVSVSPSTIAAHSTAALAVSIPSTCTSATYDSGTSSSGDYAVTIRMMTSAGTYSVTAGNKHEILAA